MNSCLEANTDLHCLEHSELFFHACFSVQLAFPSSEKPPESVLEGEFSWGSMPPDLDYGVQSTPSLIPYGNLTRQVFLASYPPVSG